MTTRAARPPLGGRFWWLVILWCSMVGFATCLGSPRAHAAEGVRQEFVRVTYYVLPGRMADGSMVHDGAAACSQWMPFGTVLEFPDGRQVVCQDRGHGDWYWRGWVDVYGDSTVNRVYGDYAWVSVLRWGW